MKEVPLFSHFLIYEMGRGKGIILAGSSCERHPRWDEDIIVPQAFLGRVER